MGNFQQIEKQNVEIAEKQPCENNISLPVQSEECFTFDVQVIILHHNIQSIILILIRNTGILVSGYTFYGRRYEKRKKCTTNYQYM